MDTIPVEILSCIFEEYTKPDSDLLGGSPRTLALVNRRWYQTALQTPSLWSTILVTDSVSKYWRTSRVKKSYREYVYQMWPTEHSEIQICLNHSQLDRTLQRAAATSLDITFRFEHEVYDHSLSSFYMLVFNEQVTPRIVNLVFESHAVWLINWDLSRSISPTNCYFPRLIRLELVKLRAPSQSSPNNERILPLILEQAPNLKEIAFSGYQQIPQCLKPHAWRNSSYRVTIENLKLLSTTAGDVVNEIYGTEVHLRELVINGAARIEKSEFRDIWKQITAPWPYPSTPKTTFMYLKNVHLILDDLSYISHLSLPLLESLRTTQSSITRQMGFGREPLVVSPFTTDLPKLRSLQITGPYFSPLVHFYTPNLETLHLASTLTLKGKAEEDIRDLFPPTESITRGVGAAPGAFAACLGNIIKLHINVNVSEIYFIQALKLLPALQEFSLVPGKQLGLELAKALTVDAMGQTPTSILCPDLRVVVLDLCSFIEWDKTGEERWTVGTITPVELSAALKQLVKSRNQVDRQTMERFTVIEKNGSRLEYVELN